MPGDVDVFGVATIGTVTGRQMGLDDPRRPCANERRSVHRDAVDRFNPRADRIEMRRAGLRELAPALADNLKDNLLHPRGAAAHLGGDKHILRLGAILSRAGEHFRRADPGGGRLHLHSRTLASWRLRLLRRLL